MTDGKGQFADRRASPRRKLRLPIHMNPPDASSPISGTIQDISAGGMNVKTEITSSPIKQRDEVWFLVHREYVKFQGRGEILWISRLGDSVGIRFTQLDKKSRMSLEELLRLFVSAPNNDN